MIEGKKETEERMELSHEPVPLYRKIFPIVVLISVIYLCVILWRSFF